MEIHPQKLQGMLKKNKNNRNNNNEVKDLMLKRHCLPQIN